MYPYTSGDTFYPEGCLLPEKWSFTRKRRCLLPEKWSFTRKECLFTRKVVILPENSVICRKGVILPENSVYLPKSGYLPGTTVGIGGYLPGMVVFTRKNGVFDRKVVVLTVFSKTVFLQEV